MTARGFEPGRGGFDPARDGGMLPGRGGCDPARGGLDPCRGGLDPCRGGLDPGRGGCVDPRGGRVPERGGCDPGRGSYTGGLDPWRGCFSGGVDGARPGGALPLTYPGGRVLAPVAAWNPGRLVSSELGAPELPGLGPGGIELRAALLVAPTRLPGGGWNGTGVATGRFSTTALASPVGVIAGRSLAVCSSTMSVTSSV
jgi:hypothetical protein